MVTSNKTQHPNKAQAEQQPSALRRSLLVASGLFLAAGTIALMGISFSETEKASSDVFFNPETAEIPESQHTIKKSTTTTAARFPAVSRLSQPDEPAPEKDQPYDLEYFLEDQPLPAAQEKKFFNDVHFMFTEGLQLIDRDVQNDYLSDLNKRINRGVRSAINRLKNMPLDTDDIRERLSLTEYLRYRTAFDPDLHDKVEELVNQPLGENIPANVRGMRIGENVLLLQALAKYNSSRAFELLHGLKDSTYKNFAAKHVALGLMEVGASEADALAKILEVYPDFVPPGKET